MSGFRKIAKVTWEAKNVVQSDLSIICDESKLDDKGCIGNPGIIVEVISPSTLKKDLSKKLSLYERVGVREYWLVYPNEQMIHVYLMHEEDKTYSESHVYSMDDTIQVSIFSDFKIALATLFKG